MFGFYFYSRDERKSDREKYAIWNEKFRAVREAYGLNLRHRQLSYSDQKDFQRNIESKETQHRNGYVSHCDEASRFKREAESHERIQLRPEAFIHRRFFITIRWNHFLRRLL